MAMVGDGAVLLDKSKKTGGPSKNMEGFLDFAWHGAHDDVRRSAHDSRHIPVRVR